MQIREHVPLSLHTTFHIGGRARYFCVVSSIDELRGSILWAKEQNVSWCVLGGGSNVLVSDTGFEGLVIQVNLKGIEFSTTDGPDVLMSAVAGEVFDTVVARSVDEQLWGLENLSHIPGSVGATPIQNVGAYGVEVGSVISSVRFYNTTTGTEETFSNEQCNFGYRDSLFKTEAGKKYVVTQVTFALSRLPHPQCSYKDLAALFPQPEQASLAAIRAAVIHIRSKKFPDWTAVGTAGSFFKNPIISRAHYQELLHTYQDLPGFHVNDQETKIPSAWVLDNICKIRGVREGDVGSYEGQALVFVNYGHATATEVTHFANKITDDVFAKTNISIEWEVTRL